MKRNKSLLIGVLVIMLASTLFWAGTAYATTGCFTDTNGHWAETFICWMNDNGITSGIGPGVYGPEVNVTRAQMSVFMKKLNDLSVAQAKTYTDTLFDLADSSAITYADTAETNAKAYADTLHTGEIRINAGPHRWYIYGTQPDSNLSTGLYDGYSRYTSVNATNNDYIQMELDFPSALYGKALNVTGVEYCYDASTTAYVNSFSVRRQNQTLGTSISTTVFINDETDRTDEDCRFYSISPTDDTDTIVDDNSMLVIWVNTQWTTAGASIRFGRVTFYFEPTNTPAPAPLGVQTFGGDALDVIDKQPTP